MSDTFAIDEKLTIDKKLLSQNLFTLLELIKKYPIVTRKLLLVRPLISQPHVSLEDALGYEAMNVIADDFKKEAQAAKWKVIDLKGNNATKANILNAINTENPDFFVYFGHSYGTYIPGQNNNQLELAITPSNVTVLNANKTASVTACKTISSIGIPAVQAGTVAYIGYKDYFHNWFTYNKLTNQLLSDSELDKDFRAAANAANIALLNGALYKDAKDIGYKKWMEIVNKWIPKNTNIAADALANANGLDFVGKQNAVARPIGILVQTS
jgi:hypothetical protein